ncbi:MAG: tryptophan synthase subunit alpha [archaeon]
MIHKGALMAHVYYGYPSEEFSLAQIKTLVENGADLIEFGIPFSDPTSDGPVFQDACKRALDAGTTPSKCIEGIRKVRSAGIKVPVIITTYYNVVHHAGEENFIKSIKSAGAQGIIVPNLPLEEAGNLIALGQKHGLHVILFATQNTKGERLKKTIENASGFIYLVTVMGVTGTRDKVAESTVELIKRIRARTDLPLMAGFGISKPEHAREVVAAGADGAIVGSAIGRIYEKHIPDEEKALSEIAKFTADMKNACRQGLLLRKDI